MKVAGTLVEDCAQVQINRCRSSGYVRALTGCSFSRRDAPPDQRNRQNVVSECVRTHQCELGKVSSQNGMTLLRRIVECQIHKQLICDTRRSFLGVSFLLSVTESLPVLLLFGIHFARIHCFFLWKSPVDFDQESINFIVSCNLRTKQTQSPHNEKTQAYARAMDRRTKLQQLAYLFWALPELSFHAVHRTAAWRDTASN